MSRPSRARGACLAALLVLFATASPPGDPPLAQSVDAPEAEDRALVRERLFEELRTASDEATAQEVEARIWRHWTTGPNPGAERMLADAMGRRMSFDYAGALVMLDRLVAVEPDWSEAWNQRAFVRYLREEYDESLADIERTLELEPKHFGALAGKVDILMRLGRPAEAMAVLRETVEIHPWLRMRVLLDDPPGKDI